MTARTTAEGAPADAGARGAGAPDWLGRFLALAAIWGTSFLFIKIALEALAPLHVALGRMLFGSATLVALLAWRRDRLPRDPRTWGHLAVAALLLNALPFSLFAYGETRVSSVLAGIWNATTPLLVLAVVLVALPGERPSRARVTGLVIGFGGVLVVLGVWDGLGGQALAGNLACFGAAVSYGFGFPYARRHLTGRPESTASLATAQVLCGTVQLAVVTPLVTEAPTSLPLRVVVSVVVLGALGTGVAYVLNYGIIRDAGATTASTVTYLIPLFSTVAGVVVLDETLAWNQPVGAAVVILGVAISQERLRTSPRRARGAASPSSAVEPKGR